MAEPGKPKKKSKSIISSSVEDVKEETDKKPDTKQRREKIE
jgi:hypothetical protein